MHDFGICEIWTQDHPCIFATYWILVYLQHIGHISWLSNDLCLHIQCSLRTLIYHSVGWERAVLVPIMGNSRSMHLVTRKLSCPAALVAKLTQDIPHIHQRNKRFYVHCSAVILSPCSSLCFGPALDLLQALSLYYRDFVSLTTSEGNQKK